MQSLNIPAQVGKVKIVQMEQTTEKEYTDGDSEDQLLTLYSSADSDERVNELLSKPLEWRIKYHVAYTRENLLNWYDFGKQSTLLEIGSGCGALTGLFAERCGKVDALDISARRSLVNAHRNQEHANTRIIIGNLKDLSEKAQYDYATSIGVLEYAGRFIATDRPYHDFLTQVNEVLKPGGHLILAIENKFGIKYWAGAKEDHTGRAFDSIEDYPHDTGVRTFGRTELEKLLKDTGFDETTFYYPFPDYKMPVDIYSDSYMPGADGTLSSDLFPTPAPDQEREYLFDEFRALKALGESDLFNSFANSFLVFARKGGK